MPSDRTTTPPATSSLAPADLAMFASLGVEQELIAAARIRRVTHEQARRDVGIRYRSQQLAGLAYPYLDPVTGAVRTYRLRRDHPEVDAASGRAIAKYVSPSGRPALYFPPGASALLSDVSASVVLLEAEKSALTLTAAATRAGRALLAIGLGGCWGWRGTIGKTTDASGVRVDEKGPLPDLDRITWRDRDVVLLLDANVARNTKVQTARRALAAELAGRGAMVRIAELPVEAGVNGPDDYRAAHGDAPLLALVDGASVSRADQPILVRLANVKAEPVSWIWPCRLALGKLTLLVGDPGLGKSWITLDIAARVSCGGAWPDGGQAIAGNVLLLSAEDGLADTIRPRLDALGADVMRVHHLAVLRAGEQERAVQLADAAALESAIRATGARLLVIDPISAYLGSTDSHRDAEVRALMAPLARVAERTGAAVLGVMHLAKSSQRPAMYRAVGSIAFAAAARVVLAVAADPERQDRRLVAPIKSNLSAPPAALAYTLADGRLTWEAGPVPDVDVNALLAGPPLDRQERREADGWLREMLADGPVLSRDIQRAGDAAGFSWRTLWRASKRLGVETERMGGLGAAGKWYWRLPAPKYATTSASDPSDGTVAHIAQIDRSTGTVEEEEAPPPKCATGPCVAARDHADDLPACLRELKEPDLSDPMGEHEVLM